MMQPYRYCHWCGVAYSSEAWPRTCADCGRTTWRNPLPVAVLLLPVREGGRTGVLTVRRGIQPRRGWLALPGGFVDWGERWQEACARETHEEAGVHVDPDAIALICAENGSNGTLLLFGRGPVLDAASLPPFTASAEATERAVLFAPEELAFPHHTRLLAESLASFQRDST